MSEPITEAEVAALEIYYKEEGHFMILPLCAAWRSLTAENERLNKQLAVACHVTVGDQSKSDFDWSVLSKIDEQETQIAEQAAEITRLKEECERLIQRPLSDKAIAQQVNPE